MTEGIDVAVPPNGTGCAECEQSGGWWFHLRCCVTCGHIGCCDTSPSQHAARAGHPLITSFEPGEDWFYDYRTGRWPTAGRTSAPAHRSTRSGPGWPVPPDWTDHLNV